MRTLVSANTGERLRDRMLESMQEKVCNAISALQGDLISLAKDLISVPTADPPGENYDQCAEVIADYMRAIGARVEIRQAPVVSLPLSPRTGKPLSRPNVVAWIEGLCDGPTLHFNGHYDVVPAVGEWTSDPFKPEIRDGRLYGRGSVDMKGAIAAMMIAAKALTYERVPLSGALSFSFVPDEENDGINGTKFLLEQTNMKADYCIVGEPSGATSLLLGHRGCLWLEIKTIGKATHASTPWAGVNAFENMIRIVNAINEEMNLGKNPDDKSGTITVGGKVVTGNVPNIVPASCTMSVDRRLAPGEVLEEVLSGFYSVVETMKKEDAGFQAEIRVLSGYDPCVTSQDSVLVEAITNTMTVSARRPTVTTVFSIPNINVSINLRGFILLWPLSSGFGMQGQNAGPAPAISRV
jgi:succinyl-diaminopimelate desuccinylase